MLWSLQAHGTSLQEYVEKHQDQSKNALRKSLEAAFAAWVEELRADQAQFCADKVMLLDLCWQCAISFVFLLTSKYGSTSLPPRDNIVKNYLEGQGSFEKSFPLSAKSKGWKGRGKSSQQVGEAAGGRRWLWIKCQLGPSLYPYILWQTKAFKHN